MHGTRRRRGNATIEFTLVGIPLLCVLISTFEMARGMWLYHTLAYAVKEGARYAAVRGQNSPNQVPLGGVGVAPAIPICAYIMQQGPGLVPSQVTFTFHSATQADISINAQECINNQTTATQTVWPPGGKFLSPQTSGGNTIVDNQAGQVISINASFTFQSSILMFWPGVKGAQQFPSFVFPAKASELMQY
jgi:hypothetical protein